MAINFPVVLLANSNKILAFFFFEVQSCQYSTYAKQTLPIINSSIILITNYYCKALKSNDQFTILNLFRKGPKQMQTFY